jgi:hypothetical protein
VEVLDMLEHLMLKELCAQLFQNALLFDQKVHCVAVSDKHPHRRQWEGNTFKMNLGL